MAQLSRCARPQPLWSTILEQPGLVEAVQALPAEVLSKLVRRRW